MLNYSINNSTNIKTNSYDLSYISYREELLTNLKDNTNYLIQPKPIRDAILSIWSNTMFKETRVDNVNYIGIDTLNPDNRDSKYNIFLGKRSYSGTSSYQDSDDILDDNLLNNSDIYFFNTKDDLEEQDTTKLSFLSGIDTFLYPNAPYISSQYITNLNTLSMNVVNKEIINLNSENYTYINGIRFPKVSQSNGSDIDNKLLIYDINDSVLKWGDYNTFLNNVGVIGSEFNFYGDVNINDYNLEFTDNRKVPVDIGGIKQNDTFGSNSISEMLKRIIYQNQKPTASIRFLPPFNNGVAEVGTNPSPIIEYTIVKKSLPTITTILSNMNPSFYPPISNPSYKTVIEQSNAIVISPINTTSQNYKITVSDSIVESTDEISLKGVYPFFYGMGNISIINNSSLSFLSKLVEDESNKSIIFNNEGIIYFLYPLEYGLLSNILDGDNNSISYNYEIITYSSPEGYWASKQYYLYSSTNTYNLSNNPTEFKFKFN